MAVIAECLHFFIFFVTSHIQLIKYGFITYVSTEAFPYPRPAEIQCEYLFVVFPIQFQIVCFLGTCIHIIQHTE